LVRDVTGPRIHALVVKADGTRLLLESRTVTPSLPVIIGREGDVGVGIDPLDPKVSRHALTVTATGDGWHIRVTNRNEADLQLWGQPSLPSRPVETVSWPRVALRVKGDRALCHLVLLDDSALSIAGRPSSQPSQLTETVDRPPPLTVAQQEAVRVLFGDLLAWPPRNSAKPLQLKQVANKLKIGEEAVRRRLEGARRKAVSLGLSRMVPLTDPEYLYVLVRAGYLQPSYDDLESPLC
jgi:hypothetical protein